MIILDENKINRTDKEKLFIEDIQNKELVIKSIENELAFFRQLRGYNNGLDNNRLYQLDKCFNHLTILNIKKTVSARNVITVGLRDKAYG